MREPTIGTLLHAFVEGHERSKLADLEWEMLPNELRGLPRLGPPTKPRTREPIRPMTSKEWEEWGIKI